MGKAPAIQAAMQAQGSGFQLPRTQEAGGYGRPPAIPPQEAARVIFSERGQLTRLA